MQLTPFAPSSTKLEIDAQLSVQKTGFVLSFVLSGDVAQVALADRSAKPSRKNELWKETCFECFFGVANSSNYFEFNGSPSGDWALYQFQDYRQGMKDAAVQEAPVLEKLEKVGDQIRAVWKIPYFTNAILQSAGVTAVVKTGSEISYWALKHAGEKADFHLRKSFGHRFT